MTLLSEIISTLSEDTPIKKICCGIYWTAVVSKNCGLSSTFHERSSPHDPVREVKNLTQKSALEIAEYAKSNVLLEASIGMAALNSMIDVNEDQCIERNAFEVLAEEGREKNVAIVGHFPFVPKLRGAVKNLWVIEKRPKQGDLPAEEAENVIPRADIVAITGTAFINHTIEGLLSLCRKDSLVMLVGATSPFSPLLFDYGVDMIAGSKVLEPQKAIRCINQGATFRQIQGIRHLIMKK